jgi:hypothetical protein
MATDGPNFPGTIAEVTDGDISWSDTSDIDADDASGATVLLLDSDPASHTLRLTGFGFEVDAADEVSLVSVTFDVIDVNSTITWKHIWLVHNGSRIGAEMSGQAAVAGGTNTFQQSIVLPEATAEGATFGVDMAVELTGAEEDGDLEIDYGSITITFGDPVKRARMDQRTLVMRRL